MGDEKTTIIDWQKAYLDLVSNLVTELDKREEMRRNIAAALDTYAALLLAGELDAAAQYRADLDEVLK
jgi:hypothetical protein